METVNVEVTEEQVRKLVTLMRSELEQAARYTPEGTVVQVELSGENLRQLLTAASFPYAFYTHFIMTPDYWSLLANRIARYGITLDFSNNRPNYLETLEYSDGYIGQMAPETVVEG